MKNSSDRSEDDCLDMIGRYDAVDWQTFSQKKNIEEIARNTKDKNDIQLTAVIEIFMTIASIVADNVLSGVLHSFVWGLILFLSVIPIILLLSKYVMRFWKKCQPGSDIPNSKDMIDLFDNDICYYALMAESYSDKLCTTEEKREVKTQIEVFCFIEACYYVNKAVYELSRTANSFPAIYSDDVDGLYNDRTISITRLLNVFKILDTVIEKIEKRFWLISELDTNANFKKLFERHKSTYEKFKDLIDANFKRSF